MVDFKAVIENLIDIGFYDIILPFILVYAVVFAILQKSKIFEGGSSDKKLSSNVNAIVAFVFGLFVVAAYNVVSIIQQVIVKSAVIILFILCVLIVLGFIFGDKYTELFADKKIKYALGITVFLTVFIILLNILGFWEWLEDWWDGSSWGDSETWTTLLVLAGLGGIMYWISKDDGGSEKKNTSKKE